MNLKMNMIYIDLFSQANSNFMWLDAFKKTGYFNQVIRLDLSKAAKVIKDENSLRTFLKDNGTSIADLELIHMGGSTKTDSMVPLKSLKMIKEKFPHVKMTAFYGDVYYNPYNQERSHIVDTTHVTNGSNLLSIKGREILPAKSMFHYPCPAPIDSIFSNQDAKSFKVKTRGKNISIYTKGSGVFIGNSYHDPRIKYLKEVALMLRKHEMKLCIFGDNWPNADKLGDNVEVYYPSNPRDNILIYKKHTIAFDDPTAKVCSHVSILKQCGLKHKQYKHPLCTNYKCQDFTPTQGWFSNRSVFPMIAKIPYIAARRQGQEEFIPTPFYFENTSEIENHINFILNPNNKESVQSSLEKCYSFASKYSFKYVIDQLLGKI